MRESWEPDFSNFGQLLWSIGGWTVGCQNHAENKDAVERAIAEGFVIERIHKAPIKPEGWPCFELTDAGLEKVRELCGNGAARSAAGMRQWYRDNAAKYENR